MDADDGASATSDCAHASALLRGSSHTLFEMDPKQTPVSTAASCDGPTLTFLLWGQNTQLRLQRASVGGSTERCTDKFASKVGMKRPRRKHAPSSHPESSALPSCLHVWFAPQMLRCKCAATRRSVLMRRGRPKLSCFLAASLTGTVFSKRVSTCVRFARAHDVH